MNEGKLGSRSLIQTSEISPRQLRSYGNFSPQEAKTVTSTYLCIEGETKNRITRALDRFDRAMRRHQPEDSAVELATALEALLGDEVGELTWKVGLRSALLVDGTREEKIVARKIVRAIYRQRGKVLHTGSAQRNLKVAGIGEMTLEQLIEKGAITAASVIKSAIHRRTLPNWFEAEIGC